MTALYLDDHARGTVLVLIGGIPGLLADLEVALTRQQRFASGAPVGRGRAGSRLLFNVGASEAIGEIKAVLRRYALLVVPGVVHRGPVEQARWLYDVLPGVPGDHWALEGIEAAFRVAVEDGFRVIDRPGDRIYLGLCECGAAVYAQPEQLWVHCECGAEIVVADQRARLLERARHRWGSAAELARLLPWFAGAPITEAAITKAGQRDKLPRLKLDGRVLYRIGDVVDWHADRYLAEEAG